MDNKMFFFVTLFGLVAMLNVMSGQKHLFFNRLREMFKEMKFFPGRKDKTNFDGTY